MSQMRAKFQLNNIDKQYPGQETLYFNAVGKHGGYPADGADENNTYARYTPSADLKMIVQNPALLGKFEIGQQFYVDFSLAE